VHPCQQHSSCWQRNLYHWRILISGLESTQCCALPWAIHQLLTGLFVPWDHSYFVFRRYKILCINFNKISSPNWNICTVGYTVCLSVHYQFLTGTLVLLAIDSFVLRTKKVLRTAFRDTQVVDRITATMWYSFFQVWNVPNLVQCLGNLHLPTGLLCLLSFFCILLAYIHTYIHIHIYIRTCIHTYTYTYIYTCIYIHIYIHTYIIIYIYTYIHNYIHLYIHTHTYVRTYVYTYIHIYI
jgi:hypothetical protein